MLRPIRLWPLAASLALVMPAVANAADPKPFEEILPESTSVFLSVRNLPTVLKWHETSSLDGLFKEAEMQPFLKKAAEAFETLIAEMKKEAGFTLADLKEACTGEVALAIGEPNELLAIKDKGGDGPIIILVEARGTRDKVREILKKGLEKVERRKRELDFRGQEIIALEPRRDEKDRSEESTVYIAHADDLLAVSLSRNFLQDTLANRTETAVKPLSQAAEFKELRAKHGKDAAIFAYANTGKWIDKLPALVPAGSGPPDQVSKVFEILGLSRVRAAGLATHLSADGAKSTYFLLAPSGPGGLLSFVWTKPQALSFPSLIPEDASSAWVSLVDFGALWKTIEDAVRTFAPSGEGQDPIKSVEAALGINLKEDLIAPLGGQVSFFQRAGKKAASPEFAILVDVKNREKLEATLGKLLPMVPFFQKSEYLGRSVWALNVPGQSPEEGGEIPAVSFSVMDTHFVVGQSKPVVEELLRRVGKEVKSVKDSADFKALAGRLPPSTTFLGYESPKSFTDLIDELKQTLSDLEEASKDDEDDGDGDDGTNGKQPVAKKADGFEEKMEKLSLELMKALPEGKVFARYIAGGVMWSFVEERTIGVTHHLVFRTPAK
jgi:hypothetical protein